MSALDVPEVDQAPLSAIDVSEPLLHKRDVAREYLRRLRREDPVHYCAESKFGPYWSVTKYKDIMDVERNHQVYSSDGTVVLDDDFFAGRHIENEVPKSSFIVMDPPLHSSRRGAVMPAFSPANIQKMEEGIRERTRHLLDRLPIGETFDWVSEVSVELTLRMLAILMGFPFEERHKLLYWSNVQSGFPGDGVVESWEHRSEVLREIARRFTEILNEKIDAPVTADLMSILAKSPLTREMAPDEFLGTITLLMTGGNDTTRNSMSGSIIAMHQHPDEFAKLKRDPSLVPVAVSEILRWQCPVTYMRRTVTRDTVLGGKQIRKGEKVVIWYLSGNRDEDVFERPEDFVIGRPNPRQHLTFGFGIHRCLGNRLAELQLRVLWEEILPRFSRIEVVGEPVRLHSTMFRGFGSLPVRLHRELGGRH